MSILLTKAFEQWVADCTTNNLPARPDAVAFALMEREPSREDNVIPPEKVTHTVSELTYGKLNPNTIVCSAIAAEGSEFSYDWICLMHKTSNTLCGVIKTPVRHKQAGESLLRNFAIVYSGLAQAAQITTPPQSWQVDISPELKKMLRSDNHLSEIAEEGEDAQRESRKNLGLKSAASLDAQQWLYDDKEGRVALHGAFGYGMTNARGTAIIANDMTTVAVSAHNMHPGRYYTFSTKTEETTGITEIIWLDNGWGDKTSQTATKLVLFYAKDGRILATIRGAARNEPVVWKDLTPKLGNAAALDVQTDIYDRTKGRVAIPGMFGFGKVFGPEDRVRFDTHSALLEWAKTAMPGRYLCYGNIKNLIPGLSQLYGMIEVIWPYDSAGSAVQHVSKSLIFHNGVDFYMNRYLSTGSGYLLGWKKLNLDTADIIAPLYSKSNSTEAPDIGGLVLAAYTGVSDDEKRIVLERGMSYSGSRLRQVVFEAEYRSSGFESTPKALVGGATLPGAYVALSGTSTAPVFSYAVITLFIRIA
ncbi:phage tail protein [Citrobacter sp. TSA-1]|uniref:phage tail-collar fiber domain-containing protein n=1 Tax=Citrobacter sp. TSA-1 TaxID=184912 RepID=UPI0020B71EF5|nr:phage tail protein [Citrobacter sp. TSA-1]